MGAHQQWWQNYYSTAAPSAGYGPLTNGVRHHYSYPYHTHTASTPDNRHSPLHFHLNHSPPTAHTNVTSHLSVLPPTHPPFPTPGHRVTLTWIQTQSMARRDFVEHSLHNGPGNTILQDHRYLTFFAGSSVASDFVIRAPGPCLKVVILVATRSIAEAVFTFQLLTDIRTHNLDVDSVAEYFHQQAGQPIPNKTTDAKQFMNPLISQTFFEAALLQQAKEQRYENFSSRPTDFINKRANCSEPETSSGPMASLLHPQNPAAQRHRHHQLFLFQHHPLPHPHLTPFSTPPPKHSMRTLLRANASQKSNSTKPPPNTDSHPHESSNSLPNHFSS